MSERERTSKLEREMMVAHEAEREQRVSAENEPTPTGAKLAASELEVSEGGGAELPWWSSLLSAMRSCLTNG